MQSLITDLYPYIGNFLDDISLLNFVMTSKVAYKHTTDYKNSRINQEMLSKIKNVLSKLNFRFVMELCFGNDLPEDRNDILKNVGKNYGMSSSLVNPEILEKSINFNTTAFIEEEKYAIKLCLSNNKTYELLFVLRIIDDYYEGDASIHKDILHKKIHFQCVKENPGQDNEYSFYMSNDACDSWNLLEQNEKITKSCQVNEYSDIVLTLAIRDNKIHIMRYQIIITDKILFKKKIWELSNGE
jgi:hypothetical protein